MLERKFLRINIFLIKLLDFWKKIIYTNWAFEIRRDGWDGRRRTIGNRVGVDSVSRVRIPLSPPEKPTCFDKSVFQWNSFLAERVKYLRYEIFALQMWNMPTAYEGTNFISLDAKASNFTIHEVNYFTVSEANDFTENCESSNSYAKLPKISFA